MSSHIKTALQWGLIGGMGMVILYLAVYLISPLSIVSLQNIYYIPLLFCMVWGAVTAKRSLGGVITYGRSVWVLFIISTVGILITTAFTILLFEVIDRDLSQRLYDIVIEQSMEKWETSGATEEQQEMGIKMIDFMFKSIWGTVFIVAYQLAIGTIISLLIALFIRRKPQNNLPPDNPEITPTNP